VPVVMLSSGPPGVVVAEEEEVEEEVEELEEGAAHSCMCSRSSPRGSTSTSRESCWEQR